MLCYRDMTFCSMECETVRCFRNKVNLPSADDRGNELPVAFADMSKGCGGYMPARIHRVTPEDAAILERRMFRILAMCANRPGDITIRTLKNACGDYLEPRPNDGALQVNGEPE